MNALGDSARSAVVGFSGSEYIDIRDAELEFALGRAPLSDRAKSLGEAYKQAPARARTTFRKIAGLPTSVVNSMISNDGVFRLGRENMGSTSSSTWDEAIARGWSGDIRNARKDYHHIVFVLHQRSGIHIESISNFQGEREILLPRTAEYRVLGSARFPDAPDAVVIELEEI